MVAKCKTKKKAVGNNIRVGNYCYGNKVFSLKEEIGSTASIIETRVVVDLSYVKTTKYLTKGSTAYYRCCRQHQCMVVCLPKSKICMYVYLVNLGQLIIAKCIELSHWIEKYLLRLVFKENTVFCSLHLEI